MSNPFDINNVTTLAPTLTSPSGQVPVPATAPVPLPPHGTGSEPDERAAADRVEADLMLMPDGQSDAVVLDTASVVGMVVWACSAMAPYKDTLATMPGMDMARFSKLSDYARALAYWQQRARLTNAVPMGLTELVQKGTVVRDRTLRDLEAHVRHGHLDANVLDPFGGPISYRKLGNDLEALSILVHDTWSKLEGRTLLTLDAMDDAYRLGARIIDACAERDLAPATAARATQMRDRAYTLVVRTYNEARSAMMFVRRAEGDADSIVPSLYTTRRAPKRSGDATGDAADATESANANANNAASFAPVSGALGEAGASASGSSMLVPPSPKTLG